MKNFTVSVLFNRDVTEALLVLKLRSLYAGCFNGVGGKLEQEDNSELEGALREVIEEVGHSPDFLVSLADIVDHETDAMLYVFYGVIDKTKVEQTEDETLVWMSVQELLNMPINDSRFAGHGDILWLINKAYSMLRLGRKVI